MDIEVALYSRLSTFAGLITLVGTRIYPDFLPPTNTQDALSFELTGIETIHAMGSDAGLLGAGYKFLCYGTTAANARAVATQVKAALRDFSGVMGGAGGIMVQRIFLEGEYDDEPGGYASDVQAKQKHFRALEFLIWYEE